MEVLSSRILIRPTNLQRSHRFYRDALGLAILREFGSDETRGIVFHLGGGQLEVSGRGTDIPGDSIALALQVRDIAAERLRLLEAGVTILREPKREFWGLDEMSIADPDGVRIVLIEIPEDHPLRTDSRQFDAGHE